MTLWLQVDPAGGVWAGETQSDRKKLCENIDELSCEKWNDSWIKEVIAENPFVNIHSLKQNASLLIKVFENLQEFNLDSIRLHKPPSRMQPAGLQTCNSLDWNEHNLPVSLGGPRRFTEVDLLTCRLQLQAAKKNDDPSWDELIELVKTHPAWPAFSFLPFSKPRSAIRLIGMLGDPRWYVNPKRSDSSQDLISAFGLAKDGLANMQAALLFKEIDGTSSRGMACAVTVLYSWCPVFLCEGEARLCQLEDVDQEQRGRWILRDYLHNPNPVDGLLLACRRFLRAMCNIWLDNLTCHREYKFDRPPSLKDGPNLPRLLPANQYSPELFVPQYEFSDNPTEMTRWCQHIAKWRELNFPSNAGLETHEGTGN